MPDPVNAYEALVAQHRLRPDDAQRAVLERLQRLSAELKPHQTEKHKKILPLLRKPRKKAPRGIYLWGNVGRGKSMLMDLFFQAAPVEKKRRVHFHAFMQEVHARLHRRRQEHGGGDPMPPLVAAIAQESALLCFDELQATDVADASLLFRLFDGLLKAGVVIVSTSNHPPASLYTGGVQRERFDKFIALIEQEMDVVALSSPEDYRHRQLKSMQRVYYFPLGQAADRFIADMLSGLAFHGTAQMETLEVQGRKFQLKTINGSIFVCTFLDLCARALGPADYLALAARADTLILTGIPRLTPEKRNEAKRFITLIDALYEHKVKLICTAEASPEQLYTEGDGAFEFRRTASRLAEMQSAKYLEAAHS